jgi:hypothetical protein
VTVAELIKKLKQMPQDAKVEAIPSDCCGCGLVEHVEVTLNSDGRVAIDASKYGG